MRIEKIGKTVVAISVATNEVIFTNKHGEIKVAVSNARQPMRFGDRRLAIEVVTLRIAVALKIDRYDVFAKLDDFFSHYDDIARIDMYGTMNGSIMTSYEDDRLVII